MKRGMPKSTTFFVPKATNLQVFDYKGSVIRTTNIGNSRFWKLSDVCSIIGVKTLEVSKKLTLNEKHYLAIPHLKGGHRTIFISDMTLDKILKEAENYYPEAGNIKNWLEVSKPVSRPITDLSVPKVSKVSKPQAVKTDLSIQASLQKAQMLIRIAEHKVVPQEEQFRLLDLATQELMKIGVDPSQINQKFSLTTPTNEEDLMKLPEVVGVITEKQTLNFKGCLITFFPAELMAEKWRSPNDKFTAKDFSDVADENSYKTPKFGFWQKVMTPQGEAREFMYIDGTIIEYIFRRRHLAA